MTRRYTIDSTRSSTIPQVVTTITDTSLSSLRHLARTLASRGPLKTLPADKRVRLLFNGAFIADTSDALYVWEHEYYPQYYLPMKSFVKPPGFDVTLTHGEAIKDDANRIIAGGLELAVRREGTAGGRDDEFRVIGDMVLFAEDLEGPARMLRNFVKVVFGVVGKLTHDSRLTQHLSTSPFLHEIRCSHRRR